jgi:Integrase core domain
MVTCQIANQISGDSSKTGLSHPFVERLIGTVRREFLDHVLFWNARDLERKLAEFQVYYNAARNHASLGRHTPLSLGGGDTVIPADLNLCAGSLTAGTSPNSQSPRDDEFETHRPIFENWQSLSGTWATNGSPRSRPSRPLQRHP